MCITPCINFLLQKIKQINYPRAMKMDSGICSETVRSMGEASVCKACFARS